ncbi:hypothetical protein FIU97_12190 [Roseivivax sp. THAF40]|uniref:hypothetical protein n=1 Tax=unclassified Roseivivax TaxID=2639302 RepID=UPI00126881F7|nr:MULTISPECIES: hypothetical protein [unclassified Roseivivax]QFS83592.1 hypothetical protein FIV09_12205 [Roseivivax sp. THAF197b]QFT47338.1 hypothetical protein FIU97_12190 [Roseivivax sp. THAF40]
MPDLCQTHGIRDATVYYWRRKYDLPKDRILSERYGRFAEQPAPHPSPVSIRLTEIAVQRELGRIVLTLIFLS